MQQHVHRILLQHANSQIYRAGGEEGHASGQQQTRARFHRESTTVSVLYSCTTCDKVGVVYAQRNARVGNAGSNRTGESIDILMRPVRRYVEERRDAVRTTATTKTYTGNFSTVGTSSYFQVFTVVSAVTSTLQSATTTTVVDISSILTFWDAHASFRRCLLY